MKKIKRKSAGKELRIPAFVIGYAAPEPPPPGFLAAWFNQEYGGPAHDPPVRRSRRDPVRGPSRPLGRPGRHEPPTRHRRGLHERVQWGHKRAAQILPLKMTSRENRDIVLLLARLARGLTVLTGGTAYDTATESYMNPSDWTDRPLRDFRIADHLRIEQVDGRAEGRVWFHTRGLSKFGVEDLETYRARGLSERPVIEAFTEMADALTLLGRAPNVGESFTVPGLARPVRVVRHRTDQSYSVRLNLREVEWE